MNHAFKSQPIDPARARREWKIHQAYAWGTHVVLAAATLMLVAVGLRVIRVPAMISLLSAGLLFNLAVFLMSDRIVRWMMDCEPADGRAKERLDACLAELLPTCGIRRPTVYVSRVPAPNAFAFGNGIWFSGLAFTEDLLALLDDRELAAVVGHELGHLRARDVWASMLVSVTLSAVHAVSNRLRVAGRASLVLAIALEAAVYVPRVLAAAISQMREYAADAHAASLLGDVAPMANALRKLASWQAAHAEPERAGMLDELLLSHPGVDSRIDMLQRLTTREGG